MTDPASAAQIAAVNAPDLSLGSMLTAGVAGIFGSVLAPPLILTEALGCNPEVLFLGFAQAAGRRAAPWGQIIAGGAITSYLYYLWFNSLDFSRSEPRVRPRDRDNDVRIVLYHYTKAQNVNLITSNEKLKPSLKENSDAQWGDGQYFTDLTPRESSTVTRHQHSYALFNVPWKWGGKPPLDDIAWMEFAIPREDVQRVAPLFGPRFPHRSIYLYPNIGELSISGLYARSGIVNFRPSRSGNR